ncbi:MAG: ATP-binding protein [Candidatus Thiodiazotropha sp. (ex Monitilora ramsayi)]|nr:ATP-binding protein [Candidatus Thiodiazotropha sp. (ex Monitilora ramsayi)]
MKTNTILYPYITALMAVLVITYLFLLGHPNIADTYKIPVAVFSPHWKWILITAFALTLILEFRIYRRRCKSQAKEITHFKHQVEELLENKKQIQARAHVYAGHADKLKLFISDKLIEYIEYDEKFLHFKSIASEVRHNGVISYDKIKTVLTEQMEQLDNFEEIEPLQSALESLIYLWDLLDLSTADNIALHIANQICESEETIFQSELSGDEREPYPSQNVFTAESALDKSLKRCFGVTLGDTDYRHISVDGHSQARLSIKPVDLLLGNENHLVLALENLISNAQFYAGQRRYRQKHAGIAIFLDQLDNFARFRVFNRGPHIDSENAEYIYQLGFSTRRRREHHGKGLGLYFVNEIVKGYDGKLEYHNIDNHNEVVSLRIETTDGEIITDVIEILIDEEKPLCRKSGAGQGESQQEWKFFGTVDNIEITHRSDQRTHRIDGEKLSHRDLIYDPSQPSYPRWQLELRRKYKNTLLKFSPLDISGVEFELRLPTLNARLNGELLSPDEETMEHQVSQIKARFIDQENLKIS